MSGTRNKALFTPANGADVGFWDQPANGNFGIIDAALGTSVNLTQTGAGAYPLTGVVSGSGFSQILQYQCGLFSVTGVLTGNVTYQFPANVGGVWYVNTTGLTLNGFTCTFASLTGGGTSVDVAQNVVMAVTCDGVNVRPLRPAGNFNGVVYPSVSGTLTPSQAGSLIRTTVNLTLALPGASAVPGRTYSFWVASGTLTVNSPSGVFYGTLGNGTTSISLPGNTSSGICSFTSDGANWIVDVSHPVGGSTTQTFRASGFLANEGITGFNGTVGYSFNGDGGDDTGIFSQGDGYINFISNGVDVAQIQPGAQFVVTANCIVYGSFQFVANNVSIGGGTLNGVTINNSTWNGGSILNSSVNDGTGGQNPMSYTQMTTHERIGAYYLNEQQAPGGIYNTGVIYPGSDFGLGGSWRSMAPSINAGSVGYLTLFVRVS